MATKIKLKQLDQEIINLLGGGGALTRDITSNVTVGAANSGTLFPKNQSLTEFAEAILLKEITPTISTTFSGSGVHEVGTSVNGSSIELKITNTPSSSITINKIEFFAGGTLLNSQPYVNGTKTYKFNYTQTISTNTTLKAILTYNSNKTLTNTGDFKFVYGRFYGPTKASIIDSNIANSLIVGFTKNIEDSKKFSWTNITLNDERFCYMYPASYGVLSNIKDGNGFDQTNSYTRYQVDITYPTNSNIVSYYVYLLNDPTTGSGFTQNYN